jgi:hypothetical protein
LFHYNRPRLKTLCTKETKLTSYSNEFYTTMERGSRSSAQEIVPLLAARYSPNSVVDVGCGTGPFANEFLKHGVSDVVGYEGIWMEKLPTVLPKQFYIYQDLSKSFLPIRKYDLCLCLEVAEHLEEVYARTLVENLTGLSEVIAFSAAIPLQGGNHHVNEQWPNYWGKLFAERNFFLEWDPRAAIWENNQIEGCYRQNLVIFSSKAEKRDLKITSLVHPVLWTDALINRKTPLRLRLIQRLPKSVFRLRKFLLNLFRKRNG